MNQNSNKIIGAREIVGAIAYVLFNLTVANTCLALGLYTIIMMIDECMTPLEPLMVLIALASAIAIGILSILSLTKKNKLSYIKFSLVVKLLTGYQLKFFVFFTTWMCWAVNYYDFDEYVIENIFTVVWIYLIFLIIHILNNKSKSKLLRQAKEVIGNDIK